MVFSNLASVLVEKIKLKGSESIALGTCQLSNVKSDPFLKNNEHCPPSGPSQNLSSPPKAVKCSENVPVAIRSWLIQP